MHKTSAHILWIFPLVTQGIVSFFLPFFGSFTAEGLMSVFGLATFPAFLFAVICYKQQYHQRNIVQLAFYAGVLMFLYSLMAFSLMFVEDETTLSMSIWESTLAWVFYALMFALPSVVYAIVVLRLFLPKYQP